MRFSLSTIAFVALLGPSVWAAPIRRQGAGVGAGCDSIVSDADTMIGESSRGTGKTVAGMLSGGGLKARQGAGVGAGCDSIVSDADTMIGESSRGTGKTVAGMLSGSGAKRQLNGIADGVTAVTGVVPGAGELSDNMDSYLNTIDGQGTDDSAEAGQIVGDEELQIGSSVGGANGQNGGTTGGGAAAPPPAKGHGHRRQLNGIADGVTAVTGTLPGAGQVSDSLDSQLNTIDGEGTDGSAQLGQEVGDIELGIGSAVGGSNGQNGGTGGGAAPPPPPHRK